MLKVKKLTIAENVALCQAITAHLQHQVPGLKDIIRESLRDMDDEIFFNPSIKLTREQSHALLGMNDDDLNLVIGARLVPLMHFIAHDWTAQAGITTV